MDIALLLGYLAMVVPGALAGAVVAALGKRGLSGVLKNAVIGAMGGWAVAIAAVSSLDFSDGEVAIVFAIWGAFSLMGGLLVLALVAGAQRLTR